MHTDIVFSLTGPDRVGIVEEVTRTLLELDGNVETSRMARLGGEFAILMLVSLPAEGVQRLEAEFAGMVAQGYRVSANPARPVSVDAHIGWLPYRIVVHGADHEGIIHEIARGLSQRGITIESMETETTRAPVSGTPLFSMTVLVVVPPDLLEAEWQADLREAARLANVDVEVSAAARG